MAKNTSHYIHFLVRHANGKPLGWIAPVEQTEDGPTGGSYVVPVARNGRFLKRYQIDFRRYSGIGQRSPTETTVATLEQSEGKSLFVFQVADTTVIFQEKPGDPDLNRLKYTGQLIHPDFSYSLAEIEPVPEESLDELFTNTGYVLIGCDPWENYDGMDSVIQGGPPSQPVKPAFDPPIRKAPTSHSLAVHEIATKKDADQPCPIRP